MSLMRQSFLPFAVAALMASAGCELIAKVDRDKIPHGSGGSGGGSTSSTSSSGTGGSTSSSTSSSGTGGTGGGTTSSSGTGGSTSSSSGTGGTGGGTTSSSSGTGGTGGMGTGGMGTGGNGGCTTTAQCPTPANECITATCTNGMCGTSFVAVGTATSNQTTGDCKRNECDGNGNITPVNDDNDPPSDNKDCTTDTCSNGMAVHTPKSSGTVCGTNLICDSNGNCVGCVQASDCGTDTTCQTRTCTGGMCGVNNAPQGTPAGTQTPGDCHKSQCDGNGTIETVVDDTDKPVDSKECTNDVCTNGVATNPPVTAGTMCTENSGTKCDGNGACVQCTQASDCGTNTACKTFTCTNGTCGSNNVASGTVVANPTAGDCRTDQCDGNGGITNNAVDDTDKPVDNNQCTNDVCTSGAPSNPPLTSGTSCSQNGGTKCNGSGACVQCLQNSDCGTDTACKTFTCNAGVCGSNNVALGTVVANPTVGDCRSNQCDGNGNITTNAVDDTDKPVDNKECTNDVCTNGVATNPPVTAGTMCTENSGTKCDGNGACVQCTQASDCGTNTACKTFTCTNGTCGSNNVTSGTVVANPTPGDCRSDQCDGNGTIVGNVVDNNDKPTDDGNQCTDDTCNAGTAVHPPKAQGTACNQNGGNICDATGNCVTCSLDTDCPAGGACQVPKCNAGTCGFVAAPMGDLPPALQTAGNCQKLACDGASQTPVSVADNTDVPVNDGNQCTNEVCNNGAPEHPPVTAGTACNQNGGTKCDGSGACVQCTQASDCPAGGACQVAACNSGTCGFNAAAAGDLPAGQQTAGDCQKLTCDGTSQAPVSVNDNADLPADDGNQCTNEVCTNGTPSHPNATAGTTCNQNGGTLCNSAGACVSAPNVASTTPADGGTAAANTTVAVTFTQAMTPATLTGQTSIGACTGSIQVSLNDFTTCVGFATAAPTMTSGNTVATFTVRPGLLINRTYKVRVTTAAQSATSVALGAQYTSATGFGTTNPLTSGTGVVISQVYGGGGNSGAIYKADFVELHNRGTTTVDIGGWAVQYVSGNGNGTWATTNIPAGKTIAPGGYFLVQEALGSGGTTDLPTPDVTGTIAMGGTAGKVALTNNTTALSGTCPTSAAIVDLVGYGTSGNVNCSEGSTSGATATQATNTTSATRNLNACADTNVNNADFTTGAVSPRNSASPAFTCTPAQNESDSALEADYCATQFPLSLSVQTGTMQTVYGRIYQLGATDQGVNPPAGITAQVGYGPTTANPEYEFGWTWTAATHNASCVDANPGAGESLCGSEDEYQATFTAPAAGTYRYAYRFSLDSGATWTYCDNRQGDAGAGANSSLAFNLEDLASFTVTP